MGAHAMEQEQDQLCFAGTVITGQQKGRTIGFPTANLDCCAEWLDTGVYGVTVELGQQRFCAMMNVGIRPTFNLCPKPIAEVHLFDFSADIYGEQLNVQVWFKVREEIKFSSVESLIDRLKEDEAFVKQQFSRMGKYG